MILFNKSVIWGCLAAAAAAGLYTGGVALAGTQCEVKKSTPPKKCPFDTVGSEK